MAIRFNCKCGQQIAARDDFAGRKVRCSKCHTVQTVPSPRKQTMLADEGPEGPMTLADMPPLDPEGTETPAQSPPATIPPGRKATMMMSSAMSSERTPPEHGTSDQEPPMELAETIPPRARLRPVAPAADPAPAAVAPPAIAPAFHPAPVRPEPPARTALAPDGILLSCLCGARYHTPVENAGGTGRCQFCKDILFVPTNAHGRDPVLAARDANNRYQPDGTGMSLLTRSLIVLLLLAVLGGGGYAAWVYHLQPLASEAKKLRPTALGLVPANAGGFISISPAKLRESPLTLQLLLDLSTKLGQDEDPLAAMLQQSGALGLTNDEIARIVGVFDSQTGGGTWIAIETSNDMNEEVVRKRIDGLESKPTSRDNRGYYLNNKNRQQSLAFVHSRLLVIGLPVKILQALEGVSQESGPLTESLHEAQNAMLVASLHDPVKMQRWLEPFDQPQLTRLRGWSPKLKGDQVHSLDLVLQPTNDGVSARLRLEMRDKGPSPKTEMKLAFTFDEGQFFQVVQLLQAPPTGPAMPKTESKEKAQP